MFAESMASIVGPTYCLAWGAGTMYGLTQVPPQKARRTKRILINTYLNNIGRTSSKYANNTAACVFLFVFVGKLLDTLLLEEYEEFNVPEPVKVAAYGAMTGAVYKSTRGRRAMLLGSVLGASVGSAYAYGWMKFRTQ